MSWGLGAAGATTAAIVVTPIVPWLRRAGYRYADEQGPGPRTGWCVPVGVGAGAAVAAAHPEAPLLALVYAASAAVLTILSVIDLDVRRLPDRWTKPLWVLTPAALLAVALVEGPGLDAWWRSLACGAGVGALFLALALLGGGAGMGLGDAKLAPTIGALLGFQSVTHAVVGVAAIFVLGGVAAGVLLLRGRRRSHLFAYGPYLAAGTVLVMAAPIMSQFVRT